MMLEFCSGGALDDLILGKLAFGKVLLCTVVSWDNISSEDSEDSIENVKKITKKSLNLWEHFCLCVECLLITLLCIIFETSTGVLVKLRKVHGTS